MPTSEDGAIEHIGKKVLWEESIHLLKRSYELELSGILKLPTWISMMELPIRGTISATSRVGCTDA
ncbi:hypothetical protein AHAS_Ahas04G0156200 [Arachis hypogaea]